MPSPVIPVSHYELCVEHYNNQAIRKKIISSLKPSAQTLFEYLVAFLREIVKHADVNGTNTDYIAQLFSNAILRPDRNLKKHPGEILKIKVAGPVLTRPVIPLGFIFNHWMFRWRCTRVWKTKGVSVSSRVHPAKGRRNHVILQSSRSCNPAQTPWRIGAISFNFSLQSDNYLNCFPHWSTCLSDSLLTPL